MEPKNTLNVNNPGEGDCGYYAVEIALIPSLLEEMHKIDVAHSEHWQRNYLLAKGDDLFMKRLFHALKQSPNKYPFLSRMYERISSGACRMNDDSAENIENQKQLFGKWLYGIAIAAKNAENVKGAFTKKICFLVFTT